MPEIETPRMIIASPIRIAFCITDLDRGGAEWALWHIVSRLDRSQWQPRVYCLGPPGALVEKFQAEEIPVVCYGARHAWDVRVLNWLRNELRQFSPQIVQGFLFHANIVSRIAGYYAGVPLRIAGHRVAEREKRWHLQVDRLTRKYVQHHICVSTGVADWLRNHVRLTASQVSVIPNGIDPEAAVNRERDVRIEMGLPPQTRILLAVGRLVPQKGFTFLLEAFQETSNQFDDTHLILIGEGPERAKLEQYIKEVRLESRVSLLGFQSDLSTVMAQAELFVLSSLWEGMPNVVLQAMQVGLPVVATAVEGVPELIKDRWSGRVVKPGSANELRHAIQDLLLDQEARTEYKKNAKSVLSEEFTWDHIARDYERRYRLLLGQL